MYKSDIVAERIKERAKARCTPLKVLFESADIGRNFMASSLKAGSMPNGDTLGKLADKLECSVDYLLGRTDNPEVNK